MPYSLGPNTDNTVDFKYAIRVTITKWEEPKGEGEKKQRKREKHSLERKIEARKTRGGWSQK